MARLAKLNIKTAATPDGTLDAYGVRVPHTNFRAAVVATQAVVGQIARTCEASSAGQLASAPAAKRHDDGQTRFCQLWQLHNASNMNALAVFELLQQNTAIANTDEFAALTRATSAFEIAQPPESCALRWKSG